MSEPTGRTLRGRSAMTHAIAIRELARLKQHEIEERPEGDAIGAAHVDLAILALDYALDLLLAGTREGQHDEIPNDETGIGVPASVDVWKDKDHARSDQSGNIERLTNAATTEKGSDTDEDSMQF